MSVRAFLTSLKSHVESSSFKGPLKFVTGNQSADLDSVISAISYSYFNSLADSSNHIIPLINIPREDLKLRRDIASVLKAHAISEDLLYFVEDFSKFIKVSNSANAQSELTLVDHCNLQGDELTQAYHDKLLKVVAIIDHHADEGIAKDAQPRIIQTNGSCSSLVFNYWFGKLGKPDTFYQENDSISLLLAPLLIDTTNMTQKVEEQDTIAYGRYRDILLNHEGSKVTEALEAFVKKPQVSAEELEAEKVHDDADLFELFYREVKAEKKNIKGFSMKDFLRKDYKQFEFVSQSGPHSRIGFSSLSKPFSWILKTYSQEEVINACASLRESYDLDVIVMTTSFTRKDNNQYNREFAYSFDSTNTQKELYEKLGELCEPVLKVDASDLYNLKDTVVSELNSIKENQIFKVYNQHNIQASRKQVVPAVKEVIERA